MPDAFMRNPVDNGLLGREAPPGGDPWPDGLTLVGSSVAMAGRLGLDHGHALGRLWHGPRSERLRGEFEAGAGPRPRPIEGGSGMHAHGDGRARALRECVAKKAGLAGVRCEEDVARRLHVLAGGAAEHVGSAGGRDECGFDLVVFAAGGTRVLEQDTERRGRIDMGIRMEEQAGQPAARGGDIL